MPAPRLNPFLRLLCCALGLMALSVAMVLMLYLGSTLASVWKGNPPAEQLQDVVTRYTLLLTVLTYPANLLWIAFCRHTFDRRSFVSLGLRASRVLPNLARGAAAGALSIGLLWAILWITGVISVVGLSPEAFEMNWGSIALHLAGYALIFVAVGCFEEILFRGYALHNCNIWLGWKGGVIAQAVVFASIHLGNVIAAPRDAQMAAVGALPALALIAVFFALCYRKTGSLWFPIGFHSAWNFFLGCVFSLPVSGTDTFRLLDVQTNQTSWLSGGQFGAEGSMLLLPILGLLIYFISRAPDHPQAVLDLGLLTRTDAFAIPEFIPVEPEEEEVEDERESRFRTKFGSSQGFSAETLRELRDLQEQREALEREAKAAAQREEMAVSSFAVSKPAVVEPVAPVIAVTPVVAKPIEKVVREEEVVTTEKPEIEAEKLVVAPAVVVTAPKPVTPTPTPAPSPVSAPTPTPAPTTEKKKPPSPRW